MVSSCCRRLLSMDNGSDRKGCSSVWRAGRRRRNPRLERRLRNGPKLLRAMTLPPALLECTPVARLRRSRHTRHVSQRLTLGSWCLRQASPGHGLPRGPGRGHFLGPRAHSALLRGAGCSRLGRPGRLWERNSNVTCHTQEGSSPSHAEVSGTSAPHVHSATPEAGAPTPWRLAGAVALCRLPAGQGLLQD